MSELARDAEGNVVLTDEQAEALYIEVVPGTMRLTDHGAELLARWLAGDYMCVQGQAIANGCLPENAWVPLARWALAALPVLRAATNLEKWMSGDAPIREWPAGATLIDALVATVRTRRDGAP